MNEVNKSKLKSKKSDNLHELLTSSVKLKSFYILDTEFNSFFILFFSDFITRVVQNLFVFTSKMIWRPISITFTC